MSQSVVHAAGLCKTYKVYARPWDRLLEAVVRRPRHREFRSLQNVSLDLMPGDSLGIIGENGAGKSTLLKILAGVTAPSAGTAQVRGKIASILELASGFHPEFTGRQNILLNAAMLGLTQEEVVRKTPDIIAFSELGEFIDQPVKVYSTGMAMRLGFAIATQVEPDVLIIDEALSVGDGYFQKKCVDRLMVFVQRGGTLLFCSHAMYYVTSFCRRALWLRDGKVAALGPVEEVVRKYETFLMHKTPREASPSPERQAVGPARILKAEVRPHSGSEGPRPFRHGDPWVLDLDWESSEPELRFHVAIGIDRVDSVQIAAFSTYHDGLPPFRGSERHRVRLTLPELPLIQGEFSVHLYLLDEHALHPYDSKVLHGAFQVASEEYRIGLFHVPHRWHDADGQLLADVSDDLATPRDVETLTVGAAASASGTIS